MRNKFSTNGRMIEFGQENNDNQTLNYIEPHITL